MFLGGSMDKHVEQNEWLGFRWISCLNHFKIIFVEFSNHQFVIINYKIKIDKI